MAKKKKTMSLEEMEDYDRPYSPHASARKNFRYDGWTPIMHIQYIMRICQEKWEIPEDKEFAASHEFRRAFFGYSKHLSWSTIRNTAKHHESRKGFVANIEGQIDQFKKSRAIEQKDLTQSI